MSFGVFKRYAGVLKELNKLADAGFLLRRKQGNQKSFKHVLVKRFYETCCQGQKFLS
jgi:hypothetical protein